MSQYAITFWLPTIISEAGVKNVVLNGVLSAIPFLVAAIAMPILGRHADITRERRWHLILALAVGGVALAISPLVSSAPALALFFLSIAAGGLLAATPLFWPLPMSFLRGMSVAAGIALINSLGNVAGFVSPSIVGALTDLTGTTNAGIYVTAAVAGIGVLLVFILPAKAVNR
jgi:MFS family permease